MGMEAAEHPTHCSHFRHTTCPEGKAHWRGRQDAKPGVCLGRVRAWPVEAGHAPSGTPPRPPVEAWDRCYAPASASPGQARAAREAGPPSASGKRRGAWKMASMQLTRPSWHSHARGPPTPARGPPSSPPLPLLKALALSRAPSAPSHRLRSVGQPRRRPAGSRSQTATGEMPAREGALIIGRGRFLARPAKAPGGLARRTERRAVENARPILPPPVSGTRHALPSPWRRGTQRIHSCCQARAHCPGRARTTRTGPRRATPSGAVGLIASKHVHVFTPRLACWQRGDGGLAGRRAARARAWP